MQTHGLGFYFDTLTVVMLVVMTSRLAAIPWFGQGV